MSNGTFPISGNEMNLNCEFLFDLSPNEGSIVCYFGIATKTQTNAETVSMLRGSHASPGVEAAKDTRRQMSQSCGVSSS